MSSDLLKNVVIIAISSVIGVLALNNREAIYAATGINKQMQAAKAQRSTAPAPINQPHVKAPLQSTGGKVVLEKNPRDGQFWTTAKVNRRAIDFLVDTGAGSVALTMEDAKRIGINTRRLDYDVPVRTAGGRIMAAEVELDEVKVGSIRVKDVKALVVPADMGSSLLGMTYLGALKKIEVTQDRLVLKN